MPDARAVYHAQGSRQQGGQLDVRGQPPRSGRQAHAAGQERVLRVSWERMIDAE